MESSPTYTLLVYGLSAVGMIFFFKKMDNAAGRSLVLLILVASIGWRYMMRKPTFRPINNKAVLTAAAQTAVGNGRITVHLASDPKAQLFEYFESGKAAKLSAVQPLNEKEWLAIFSTNTLGGKAPEIERDYRGWFEKPVGESNETLPLVTNQKAIDGSIRVEDSASGETLFAYADSNEFKPVAIVKQKDKLNQVTYQVIFSNQDGLLSQSTNASYKTNK